MPGDEQRSERIPRSTEADEEALRRLRELAAQDKPSISDLVEHLVEGQQRVALQTYPRYKVLAMCADLGHDPNRVSRITIDPTYVTVEYVHPIIEGANLNEAIPLED